ncbi:MAG: glycyl-radical enzyme activating protein [Halieaceae bacterium]|jgi:pyruvate formate lyase activating enzyme|nr:glycyl-radical enzyme activating protein [Halieaceae bacterium]
MGLPESLLATDQTEAHTARVSNVQFYNVHDGPGIRTVVFLKGCPLTCKWCSNPETISTQQELGLNRSLCTGCGACLDACPQKAISLIKKPCGRREASVDRGLCTDCGDCVASCIPKALTMYGDPMSVEQVFKEFQKDKMFFGPEGGATFSGGEALLHPDFVAEVFALCKADGIHTCLETTGSVSRRALEKVLPVTDLFLFDLKHMDSEIHRLWTGAPNTLIHDNARWLASQGVQILFRVPLIPGFNDCPDNVQAMAAFVGGLDSENIDGIELLPYHAMGTGKYQSLDQDYLLCDLKVPEEALVEALRKEISALGVPCSISR